MYVQKYSAWGKSFLFDILNSRDFILIPAGYEILKTLSHMNLDSAFGTSFNKYVGQAGNYTMHMIVTLDATYIFH